MNRASPLKDPLDVFRMLIGLLLGADRSTAVIGSTALCFRIDPEKSWWIRKLVVRHTVGFHFGMLLLPDDDNIACWAPAVVSPLRVASVWLVWRS